MVGFKFVTKPNGKFSKNESNTQYTVGTNGTSVITGTPEINYEDIAFINDGYIYTHGKFYKSIDQLVGSVTSSSSSNEIPSAKAVYDALNTFELNQSPYLIQVKEDGFFVIDENYNVGMKYTSEGIDAAKISSHFKTLI